MIARYWLKTGSQLHFDKQGKARMKLRQVLVLSRDIARSTQFYQEGLGLKLLRSSDTFAEFDTRSGVPLCVKLAQKCASIDSGLLECFRVVDRLLLMCGPAARRRAAAGTLHS